MLDFLTNKNGRYLENLKSIQIDCDTKLISIPISLFQVYD